MMIQLDAIRSIEIPLSDKYNAYVVAASIGSREAEIVSKHRSGALAIRAGMLADSINRNVWVVLEDGQAYHPEIFYKK